MSAPPVRLLAAAVVATLAALPIAVSAAERDPALPASVYVQPAEVKQWIDVGRPVTFLDVREADEFAAGHLPGARNIPHDKVASIAGELPHDQPVVVYCIHSAHRAPDATKVLRKLGFDNASVLEGGIVAWQAGGLSIRASDLSQAPKILPATDRCQYKNAPYPSTTADASATGAADAIVADTRGAHSP